MFPPPGEAGPEVERIQSIIGKYFVIYDVRYSPPEAVAVYIRTDEGEIDEKFEGLRREMVPLGYIPFIGRNGGEHVILVGKSKKRKFYGAYVNLALLLATIATTIISGSVVYISYENLVDTSADLGAIVAETFRPGNLGMGALVFALPLMLILGIHEFGHYWMARRHHVKASLPFFIPMPPFVTPLGTLGAFISIREPIPNKKALMDIGAAGPIAGLVVAIPVTLVGLHLTVASPHMVPPDASGSVELGTSLLYMLLALGFPLSGDMMIHPTAFAGWVGLLVTALNLLPAGQLDGGHISRALFGPNVRWLSMGVIMLLFVAGFFFGSFMWVFFAVFILFFGINHPPPLNDLTRIDVKRRLMGVFCMVILVLTFVPQPIQEIQPSYEVELMPAPGENFTRTAHLNSTVNLTFTVRNTGSAPVDINVTVKPAIVDLTYKGIREDNSTSDPEAYYRTTLAVNETRTLTMFVFVPANDTFLNRSYSSKVVVERQDAPADSRVLATLFFRIDVR